MFSVHGHITVGEGGQEEKFVGFPDTRFVHIIGRMFSSGRLDHAYITLIEYARGLLVVD